MSDQIDPKLWRQAVYKWIREGEMADEMKIPYEEAMGIYGTGAIELAGMGIDIIILKRAIQYMSMTPEQRRLEEEYGALLMPDVAA